MTMRSTSCACWALDAPDNRPELKLGGEGLSEIRRSGPHEAFAVLREASARDRGAIQVHASGARPLGLSYSIRNAEVR
jgi:hypothetical protein